MIKGFFNSLFGKKDTKPSEIQYQTDLHPVLEGIVPVDYKMPTISEYRAKQTIAFEENKKLKTKVNHNRVHMNEVFFLKKYGKVPKKTNWANMPGFMSMLFNGFIVGRRVSDEKVVVFCGIKDTESRTLNGKSIKYSTLCTKCSSRAEYRGFLWYKVSNKDALLLILNNAVFEDEESRVWLEDYFEYMEFVEQYKIDNPDVLVDLPERQSTMDYIREKQGLTGG